jgi:L-ascorbate metabolism protein UlaG (beta-lactamase superfamily)
MRARRGCPGGPLPGHPTPAVAADTTRIALRSAPREPIVQAPPESVEDLSVSAVFYRIALIRRYLQLKPVAAAVCLLASGCSGLARTDAGVFPPPERNAITFWGHACAYVDVDGVGIVTDPVFRNVILSRHRRGPAPPPSSYAGARVVLISHAHPDHMDPPTLRTLPEEAVILCPEPVAEHLKGVGRDVQVMHGGDVYAFDGGTITAVSVHHMGGRWGLTSGTDGRALGYVIETPQQVIFYSGDSNYFSGFSDVGWSFDPDILMLNVNGHLSGTDATRSAWATRARVVIPLHWGTLPYWIFGGNDRPRDEQLMKQVVGDRLHVLEVGQSYPLAAPRDERQALP